MNISPKNFFIILHEIKRANLSYTIFNKFLFIPKMAVTMESMAICR